MGRRTDDFHIPLPRSSLATMSPPGALRKECGNASLNNVLLLESCLFSPPLSDPVFDETHAGGWELSCPSL